MPFLAPAATAIGGFLGTAGGAAIASGAVGLLGSAVSARAAGKAADRQAASADAATQVQWNMYKQTRQDQLPWLQAGQQALGRTANILEQGFNYQESPGYKMELAAGQRAIPRIRAAQGLLGSGKTEKDLTEFSVRLANQDRASMLNEWLSTQLNPNLAMSGAGQVTAGNLGVQGYNTGAQVGQNTMAAGNALAMGGVNQANAWTQGFQNTGNALANIFGTKAGQPEIPPNPSAPPTYPKPVLNSEFFGKIG